MERNYKKILSLMSLLLPVMGWSQIVTPTSYTTDIITVEAIEEPGEWDGPWELTGEVKVTFTGIANTFGGETQYISDGLITVDIENLGPTDSKIVQFFLLRPTLSDGSTIGQGMGGQMTDGTSLSDPATWTMANSLSSELVNTDGYGNPASDYFGMTTDVSTNPLTIPENLPNYPSNGTFVFYFQGLAGQLFNPDEWFNTPDKPLVFLRWKSVGNEDNQWMDSAKGYSGGPSFDPSIPEPREVALLAMLGLGGLLWTRRRFVKK